MQRNKQALPKESDCSSNQRWNRIHQPSFCHTQSRGEMVASDKSQSIKCLCSGSTLQDGVNQVSKKIDTEGRLADQVRFKRCLLDGASAPLPSEVPQILLARPIVAICSPPVWTKQCSLYIHQFNETSGGNFEEVRDLSNFISGRYAHNGELSRQNQRSLSVCNFSPNFSWICSE